MMIKITGGKFKRKKLESISKFVRPTSAIKREAFFSILESYALKKSINFYENKIFLDLFAGIGTMGLEGISRGIDQAIFFENNYEVIEVLEKNCKKICRDDQYKIFNKDILKLEFKIEFKHISIIYIDPPYNKYDIGKLLENLQDRVNKETIIAVESSIKDNFQKPEKLQLIKKNSYGKTNLYLFVLK